MMNSCQGAWQGGRGPPGISWRWSLNLRVGNEGGGTGGTGQEHKAVWELVLKPCSGNDDELEHFVDAPDDDDDASPGPATDPLQRDRGEQEHVGPPAEQGGRGGPAGFLERDSVGLDPGPSGSGNLVVGPYDPRKR